MFRLSVGAALLATLLASAPQTAAQASGAAASDPARTETLRGAAAAVDSFHAALRRGDAKAALALVADEAVVFEEGRAERSKAEYARSHAEADAAFSKAVPSVRSRRTGHAAANLAWIASESRTKGSFNGRPVDRIMVESMVLRRDKGRAWKIVHIHWSSAQPSTE